MTRAQSSSRFAFVALACGLSIAALVVTMISMTKLRNSLGILRQSNDTRAALESISSKLKDAETAQRGFVISGDDSYLQPLDAAQEALPDLFAKLYVSAEAGTKDQPRYVELRRLTDRKLAELRESIVVRRRIGANAAREVVLSGEGKQIMDEIRVLMTELIDSREKMHESLRQKMWVDLRWGEVAAVGSGGLALVCGALALVMFRATMRKLAEAERMAQGKLAAERSDREKSAFLATMSHEIRTPMNAILGFSEILRDELKDERQREFADSILSSGRSLLRLINDILDLSKIEAGKLEIRTEATDLRALAHFVERLFAQQAKESAVEWKVTVADNLPPSVLIDELRLRQVVLNLVGNAFKFTRAGTVGLNIGSARSGGEIRSRVRLSIEVRDTGSGIPREKLERIFEPFVQAGNDPRGEASGTGLGLAIVQRLVGLMQGRIRAESELGRGTVFTVEFPEVEISSRLAPQAREDALDRKLDFNELRRARILVVDDNETNRALARGILNGSHHEIMEAVDGREAVSRVLREKPDVVLMDMRMPGLSGYEALAEIRKCTGFELVPVIAVTASSLQDEENNLRESFSGYIRKPFSRAELFAELSAFLPREARLPTEPPAAVLDGVGPLGAKESAKLRRLLGTDYPKVRDGLAAADVRAFCEALAELAAAGGGSPGLVHFVSELRGAAEKFSVSELETVLARFPELAERLAPSSSPA